MHPLATRGMNFQGRSPRRIFGCTAHGMLRRSASSDFSGVSSCRQRPAGPRTSMRFVARVQQDHHFCLRSVVTVAWLQDMLACLAVVVTNLQNFASAPRSSVCRENAEQTRPALLEVLF